MKFMMLSINNGTPELVMESSQKTLHRIDKLYRRAVTSGMARPTQFPSADVIMLSADPVATAHWLDQHADESQVLDIDDWTWDIPLRFGDIYCIGRNYVAHAEELGNEKPTKPIVFTKPTSSLIPNGGTIQIPEGSERIDYEGELVLVIGKNLQGQVSDDEAREAIFGVTLMNDVTDRATQNELKKKGLPWLMAKGRYTFAPLGPVINVIDKTTDLNSFALETRLNDEVCQSGSPELWIFSAQELIKYLASTTGLKQGDLIATGTPAGVGPMKSGDKIEIFCEEIGTLTNFVK